MLAYCFWWNSVGMKLVYCSGRSGPLSGSRSKGFDLRLKRWGFHSNIFCSLSPWPWTSHLSLSFHYLILCLMQYTCAKYWLFHLAVKYYYIGINSIGRLLLSNWTSLLLMCKWLHKLQGSRNLGFKTLSASVSHESQHSTSQVYGVDMWKPHSWLLHGGLNGKTLLS